MRAGGTFPSSLLWYEVPHGTCSHLLHPGVPMGIPVGIPMGIAMPIPVGSPTDIPRASPGTHGPTCSASWCLCSAEVFSSSAILVCCCCTTDRKCLMQLWLGSSSLGISKLGRRTGQGEGKGVTRQSPQHRHGNRLQDESSREMLEAGTGAGAPAPCRG